MLGCSNSRTIERLKLVSDDCAQSIDEKRSPGLPVAQADEVEPDAVRAAAVLAERDLAHPLQDEQLDLGDVGEVDERRDLLVVPGPHGIGTRSMMSWMTASVVRPWLAACGPSQMRWPRTYGASSWMSSG